MEFERRNINKDLGDLQESCSGDVCDNFKMSILFNAMHSFILKKILKNGCLNHKKVLFIGGGIGREILCIKNNCKNFYSINLDINFNLLQICRRYFKSCNIQCEVVLGDGMQLPCKDSVFDLVILYNSIHHMDDLGLTLKESFRVGKQICIVDRRKCIASKIGKCLRLIKPEEGGFYANELDTRWFFKMLKDLPNIKTAYLEYHFFYLLFINKKIHNWISRLRLFSYIDIAIVTIINSILGFLGNGMIIILNKESEYI